MNKRWCIWIPVGHEIASRLSNFDVNAGVGDDNGQTRNEESESEEEFLGRLSIGFARQNGAGECRFV